MNAPERNVQRATLFEPDRNCWRVEHAERVALLVDANDYFSAFAKAALRATRSIIILAWDFDSRTPLLCRNERGGPPPLLGDFLNYLVKRRRSLNIHVLDWDYPMVFGTDREFPPMYGLGWKPRRRVHLRYDNTHPVASSHHQKVVVIDDAVAFCGGLDLTSRRWDTCEHKPHHPMRMANGNPYPPFHDAMAMVDGSAAHALGELARERWRNATGEVLSAGGAQADPWPEEIVPQIRNATIGIARTIPVTPSRQEVREIEALYLDMINRARHQIYIENQYFTAHQLGDALEARLSEPDGPEVIVVLRLLSHGWLEEQTMEVLRLQLIQRLRKADRWNRFGVYYPHVPELRDGTCVDVHSKIMVVDDEWLRVGSANFCNRSMGTDTECDLTIEAAGDPGKGASIRRFRDELLAEHLDVGLGEVEQQISQTGSLNGAIRALQSKARTLRTLEAPAETPTVNASMAALADPEKPVALDQLINEFAPDMTPPAHHLRWSVVLGAAAMLVALLAAWRYTPLAQLATPDRMIGWAHEFGGLWWAPLVVIAAYTPGCFVMFPRPLITLFAVVAFGTKLGVVYALTGILLSAEVTYFAGRLVHRDTVRRIAGARLNRVSEILRRRGLIAMTALRLVPLAPFAVLGLVAGAIRVKLWHFTLGTALGMLPGTATTILLGDQIETALRDPGEINYWPVAGAVLVLVGAAFAVRRWLFSPKFAKSADTGP
jgi:phospholipase D1/2